MTATKLKSIPCNIITGFLGVGKTTTILNLLKQKPSQEKWAVLVNEFGEIGLDGALIEAEQNQSTGVFIREVPGGCMCCTSGLPMQIALNMLLMKAKPDRLLIEPTGLGHPKEVIKVLSGSHYQDVLTLKNTLTLVDARHFSSQKHLDNTTFQQQLEVADLLVVNKADLAHEKDIQAFKHYLADHLPLNLKPFVLSENGQISLEKLDEQLSAPEALKTLAPNELASTGNKHHHAHNLIKTPHTPETIPSCGFLVKTHHEAEFTSLGWRFDAHRVFDIDALLNWLPSLNAYRVKALLSSKTGLVRINVSEHTNAISQQKQKVVSTSCSEDKSAPESRLELIFEGTEITKDFIEICTENLLAMSH